MNSEDTNLSWIIPKTEPYSEDEDQAEANSFPLVETDRLENVFTDYPDESKSSKLLNDNFTLQSEHEEDYIKLEEIDIKSEIGDDCISSIFFQEDIQKSNVTSDFDHHNDNKYKCNSCSHQTHSPASLNNHLSQYKNGTLSHKCDQCCFQTFYAHSLKRHLLRHKKQKDVQIYQCKECNFETPFKYNLLPHVIRHEKQFIKPRNKFYIRGPKCPKCDYQTSDPSNFRRHFFSHHGSAHAYTCFHCGHQTKRKDNLEIHIFRRHMKKDEKTLTCKNCSFTALSLSDLQIHVASHKKSKSKSRRVYSCAECHYQTIYKVNIDRHAVFHQKAGEINIFRCFLCNYTAIRKDELRNHILRHSKKTACNSESKKKLKKQIPRTR